MVVPLESETPNYSKMRKDNEEMKVPGLNTGAHRRFSCRKQRANNTSTTTAATFYWVLGIPARHFPVSLYLTLTTARVLMVRVPSAPRTGKLQLCGLQPPGYAVQLGRR